MAKKKKAQDLDSILARADKLWERGNYPLAEKEYVKALNKGYQGDLTHKLAVCREANAKQTSKELSKKGRTQLSKQNIRSALKLFEQAHELHPQDWLQEKIQELQEKVKTGNSLENAREAEVRGDYRQAAQWYDQACQGPDVSGDLSLKKAACLVKAGDFEAAVQDYDGLEPSSNQDFYNQGFALIKTGRLYEGLWVWDRIQRGSIADHQWQQFQEQMAMAVTALAHALVRSIRDDRYSEDPAVLCRQIDFLLDRLHSEELKQDLRSCRPSLIQDLWSRHRYQEIERLLDLPLEDIDSRQISTFAKLYFKLAQLAGSHLDELRMFWLTAVYDDSQLARFASEPHIEQVRARLIHMAEERITQARDHDEGMDHAARVRWNTDKAVLARLSDLIRASGDEPLVLFTPDLAARFGRTRDMLAVIQRHKKGFQSEDEYLQTGGYYSRAGQSLYLLDEGACNRALAALPQADEDNDEFFRYVLAKVYFYYFLHCLETGEGKAERCVENFGSLFDLDSKYERLLLQYADKATERASFETLQRYESGLQKILSQISSRAVAQRLSLIMSIRAIQSHNRGKLANPALASQLKQALRFDPENEHALGNLRSTMIEMDILKMIQAVDKGKLKKAGNIAAQSEYPEVRDHFFEKAEEMLDDINTLQETETQWREMLLNELQAGCSRVDPLHPLLGEIAESLQYIRSS